MNIETLLSVDRTYVINLKRRVDKLHACSAELAKLGVKDFQLVEAVDAIDLQLQSPRLSPSGAIGCTLSHRIALWDAVNRGYETVMVCEDDIIIVPDKLKTIETVLKSLPDNWTIFWPGSGERYLKKHEPRFQKRKVNGFIYKTDDPVGSHIVLYRGKDIIRKAYELMCGLGHVDCELAHLGRLSETSYAPIELLIDQKRNQTDIWPEHAAHYKNAWYANK